MTPDFDEVSFWRFDARRKGYAEWKGAPQSERDAFKAEARIIAREARREALEELITKAAADHITVESGEWDAGYNGGLRAMSRHARALIEKEGT